MHVVYRQVARILAEAETSSGLCADTAVPGQGPTGAALATYRCSAELEQLLQDALRHQLEPERLWWRTWLGRARNRWLARVALYELRLGRGRLLPARGLTARKMKTLFTGPGNASTLRTPSQRPTGSMRAPSAFRFFWLLKRTSVELDEAALERAFPNSIEPDLDFPNFIWRFSGQLTPFLSHEWVQQMRLIVQDKGSCMAALAVRPEPSWQVIDACAAPGNKSMFLANMLNGEGRVYAFERDSRRHRTMVKRIQQARLEGVIVACCRDFARVVASEDANLVNVQAILLDPSCSGSGMANQRPLGERYDAARVGRLAEVQRRLLRHALLAFPQAKRVVYSTCSVLWEENEQVVQDWELETLFPFWPDRGLAECRAAVRVPAQVSNEANRGCADSQPVAEESTFGAFTLRERFYARSAYFIAAFQRHSLPGLIPVNQVSQDILIVQDNSLRPISDLEACGCSVDTPQAARAAMFASSDAAPVQYCDLGNSLSPFHASDLDGQADHQIQ
ncbi:putative 28S rRNA (cytosine-C(5))-methyltransferase [Cyanidiococcus yangmingshanensis]|uniref:Putative 28S rRNA (Cytosine-C(5))-methyltransferase n=1 Tax=Cyanidiococcus yangmingshanensis TaxID=2690220 RepID=A0A7J7IP18_9RHOD|nr:putative 28S rRNA (cytosine-C(5))-methyltransferase [Cyanidiococcus yangmingshanensis]